MSIRTWCGAVLLASMACVTALAGPAAAAGPWKIQIVDAETKQPLDGVVVVAAWFRSDGHLHRYLDSEERITGTDGRIVIAARTLRSAPGWEVVGPYLHIFKPGYRTDWRYRGQDEWKPGESWRYDESWQRMSRGGVVLELWPAKTREERLKALPDRPGRVPWSRMERFQEAINRERRFLGLQPFDIPSTED